MLITSSGPVHAHHRYTLPDLRPALMKIADYALALHYRYIRMRIEGELRGPAGRLMRRNGVRV
ncbi:MAG TPA: hypothetical protein VNT02_02715 [Burkholderiales bacterium]|nr:hypothetical protein [Burkholderiales bacterium]